MVLFDYMELRLHSITMPTKTLKEIAEWYDVTNRTVHTWLKLGAPLHQRGGQGKLHFISDRVNFPNLFSS